jgi:hypothetical protein
MDLEFSFEREDGILDLFPAARKKTAKQLTWNIPAKRPACYDVTEHYKYERKMGPTALVQ